VRLQDFFQNHFLVLSNINKSNIGDLKMKQILLLSQCIMDYKNFISYLQKEYEVDGVGYMQTTLYKLKKPKKYGLIIVEVSMPPRGVYTLQETSDGMRTGIVFYERALKHLNIPVIFWSWGDELSGEIAKLDGNVIFVKREIDYDHLRLAVEKFVGKL